MSQRKEEHNQFIDTVEANRSHASAENQEATQSHVIHSLALQRQTEDMHVHTNKEANQSHVIYSLALHRQTEAM